MAFSERSRKISGVRKRTVLIVKNRAPNHVRRTDRKPPAFVRSRPGALAVAVNPAQKTHRKFHKVSSVGPQSELEQNPSMTKLWTWFHTNSGRSLEAARLGNRDRLDEHCTSRECNLPHQSRT